MFAIVGDALENHKSISIVRMGDGEKRILESNKNEPFTYFNKRHKGWNKKLGISGMPTEIIQKNILAAGNGCTYFAPSVSGISLHDYYLHHFFNPRPHYFDNFYINDWTKEMISMLFEASDGVFIIHREYKKIINNFKKNYTIATKFKLDGFAKNSWRDNDQAIDAATKSTAQLVLYSGGPGGKIIGPQIAKVENKIVLDVGNTLLPWSEK